MSARWSFAVYLACGLAIFAPALTMWFVADDWDFLILVARAGSPAVCFVPLVGRFVRPLVMLTYYVNYHLFGLWPFPYHLSLLLVHIVNAWLVSRLAARLGASGLAAFGAGLIFLVFAGHVEAVSWVAGAADPWLVLFLLTGLLLFARALEADRASGLLAATCAVFACGFLAKETAVIAPALAVAYGASALLAPGPAPDTRRIVRRTLIVAVVTAAAAAAYLAVRANVFGSVLGAYDQLGTSRGVMFDEGRKFVLRSFLPAGRVAAALWVRHYDLALLAAAAMVMGFLFLRHPRARHGLAFLVAALVISLAPVLPLTISLSNTVSERYVYVATVFSCILAARTIELLSGRRRVVAAATIALVVLVHTRALVFANHTWVDGGNLARTVMDDIIAMVRASSPATRTLVLNVPDTARGAFVIRAAFLNSFYLVAPDVEKPEARVLMVASSAMATPTDTTRVIRIDRTRFAVELDEGRIFVQPVAPVTTMYGFDLWTPRRYVLALEEPIHRVALAYTSGGRVHPAAVVDAVPFGALDVPPALSTCAGESIRFSGWALDDEGARVIVEREAPDGTRVPLGAGVRRAGTRPDVTAGFPEFPDADRAEWNFALPCAGVRAAGGRTVIHVIAEDAAGQRTELGTRTVTSR